MSKSEAMLALVEECFKREIIKKLVFSRPLSGEITKVSARQVSHKSRRLLALEFSLPGNTVSNKNLTEATLHEGLSPLFEGYAQVNLITAVGDAEYKLSSKGKEVLLGADKLMKKIEDSKGAPERALETLDRRKDYILKGGEPFLIRLGVSDKNGRIHDKKQGKWRQINRFLEYVEGIYSALPADGELIVYDLCCGKSYLSFAIYHYLCEIKHRQVRLLGIDLKRDVINWCADVARDLGYGGMNFVCDDVKNTPKGEVPHLVVSLHACDLATDVVIDRAAELGASAILSTPCCHRYLNDKIRAEALSPTVEIPHLRNKLAEALTDTLRILRLRAAGYEVTATELTDPDDTPKNTLIQAIKGKVSEDEIAQRKREYENALKFLFSDKAHEYLKEI